MGMPEIPPQHHRPDLYHTIIDLLESIALEETALSHLLNAEAEKIQHFICHISSCTPPDVLIDFNVVVNETLETIIMKEWLLLRKLEKVTRLFDKRIPPKPHSHSHCSTCSTCKSHSSCTKCSSCSSGQTCSSCTSCNTCSTCTSCSSCQSCETCSTHSTCKSHHGCGCR
jgi:hypothetical protein